MKENEVPDGIPIVQPFHMRDEYFAVCPYCGLKNDIYPIDHDLAYEQGRCACYECLECSEEFYVGPNEKNLENISTYENL